MTGRSTTARRTRGMARDWCGSAAKRHAKKTSRGATTKKESGWTRDAAASLLWGVVTVAVVLGARGGGGGEHVGRVKGGGEIVPRETVRAGRFWGKRGGREWTEGPR